MLNSRQHKEAVRKVYETYWDSYTNGDLETFASTLDETYEMIGASETEAGWKVLQQHGSLPDIRVGEGTEFIVQIPVN